MRKEQERVIREAMRLYRYWVKAAHPTFWPEGFWYPLGSRKYAVPFGKACAALAKKRKAK